MKALILAGGLGTRLRSLVADRPKSMAEVAGQPFLVYQLDSLRRQGFCEVVLCTGYMSKIIEEHFGDGGEFGVQITYSVEDRPMGTAGAIRGASHLIDGTFVAMNGDTYVRADLPRLIEFHRGSAALATVGLSRAGDLSRSGQVAVDPAGRVLRFSEKDASSLGGGRQGRGDYMVNAGVYVFEREVLEFIASERSVSLELEVLPHLVEIRAPLYGCILDAPFVDMGTPEGYRRMQEMMGQLRGVQCGSLPA